MHVPVKLLRLCTADLKSSVMYDTCNSSTCACDSSTFVSNSRRCVCNSRACVCSSSACVCNSSSCACSIRVCICNNITSDPEPVLLFLIRHHGEPPHPLLSAGAILDCKLKAVVFCLLSVCVAHTIVPAPPSSPIWPSCRTP